MCCLIQIIISMENLQKTVTLTGFTIYNCSILEDRPAFVLSLSTSQKSGLFNKTLKAIRKNGQLFISLGLRITYACGEKQLLISIEHQNNMDRDADRADFIANLEELSQKEYQYIKSTLNNNWVLKIGSQNQIKAIPKIGVLKSNSSEIEDFIKQREEFLNNIQKRNKIFQLEPIDQNVQRLSTPFFMKQISSPRAEDLTPKIYQLLSQTRNLRSQKLYLGNNYSNESVQSSLFTGEVEGNEQQQIFEQFSRIPYHQVRSVHQHYHHYDYPTHSSSYSNKFLKKNKSIDYETLPSRTKDSQSLASSRQEVSIEPIVFDAKSPFKNHQG